jgi:hypothetical protein
MDAEFNFSVGSLKKTSPIRRGLNMLTIEVYSTTSRKYKVARTVRSRGAAFLALSLVKGRARVKNADGVVIAHRHETDGSKGKLSLVK